MKSVLTLALGLCLCLQLTAQQPSVFQLMERRDISLQQIEQLANQRFAVTGTGKGTGYKQFQRWLKEMKYHVDANGNFLPAGHDWKAYLEAKPGMQNTAQPNLLTTGNWTELGPTNWTATNAGNPGVGRLRGFAIHPSDTAVIYVVSEAAGIWKSSNSGAGWKPLTDDDGNMMKAFSIAIAPSNKSILYAGLINGVIIKSTDGGNTWSNTTALSGTAVNAIRKIVIHPANANILFAGVLFGAGEGIYRSANGGASWTQVHNQGKEDIELKPGNPDIMYASGNGNAAAGISPVWRSADNGLTWTAVDAAHGMLIDGRTQIAVTPANANIVYALQASGERFSRFYRSANSGNSFATIETGDPAAGHNYFSYNTGANDSSGIAGHAMALCGHPANANDIHIASVNIWHTADGGKNFHINSYWYYPEAVAAGGGYTHADVHSLEIVGNTLYTTTDGGIFKSRNNGLTWIDLSAGLGISMMYQASASPANANVYAAATQDNGSIYHTGSGWFSWAGGDGVDCVVSHANENTVWGALQFGSPILRSTNGGQSFTGANVPSSAGFTMQFVQHPTNAATLFGGYTGVYKSTDAGSTWSNISGTVITAPLVTLAVAPSNPAYIYAAGSNKLYVTKNGGTSWTTLTMPVAVTDIAISPFNAEKIWLGCNGISANKVLVSVNAGASLTDISFNLPNMPVRGIAADDNLKESIYIGMGVGVYYTDKTMNTWLDMRDNLPAVPVADLEIQQATGKLRAATFGRGLWEMPLFIPPCGITSAQQISSVIFNSARLTWNAVPGAVNYTVQYKGLTDPFPINATASQNLFDMTNLRPEELYTVKVSASCEGASGSFSNATTFITPPNPCQPPASLSAAPAFFSATLNWSAVSNVQYYEIRYRKASETNFQIISNITTTTYTLTPLAMNTSYFVQIWAYCSAGSPAFATVNFTTLNLLGRSITPAIVGEPGGRLQVAPNPVQGLLWVTGLPAPARTGKPMCGGLQRPRSAPSINLPLFIQQAVYGPLVGVPRQVTCWHSSGDLRQRGDLVQPVATPRSHPPAAPP